MWECSSVLPLGSLAAGPGAQDARRDEIPCPNPEGGAAPLCPCWVGPAGKVPAHRGPQTWDNEWMEEMEAY